MISAGHYFVACEVVIGILISSVGFQRKYYRYRRRQGEKTTNLLRIALLSLLLIFLILSACGPSEDDIAKAIEGTRTAEEASSESEADEEEARAEVAAKQTADAQMATQQFVQG